uniref:Sepiapterin reductase n=1 Tax=Panagrolaimus superbus TaxID=310955 RepID=A0A914XZE7_9BILA
MASDCAPESAFVLMARNAQLLEHVKLEITELNPKAKVAVIIADFSSDKPIEKLEEVIKALTHGEQIEAKFIFHNAGTIGDVAKSSSNLTNTQDWHDYLHINLISMIALNCQLYKILSEINDLKTIVVNTTSLAALQPISSFTQYCVGKAAREAYFRNFALETDSRVLNYSPGPVETDMITEIGKSSFDPQIREMFSPTSTQSTDSHRKRLTPKETVSKLIAIIDKNEFDNGGRVDYFDS